MAKKLYEQLLRDLHSTQRTNQTQSLCAQAANLISILRWAKKGWEEGKTEELEEIYSSWLRMLWETISNSTYVSTRTYIHFCLLVYVPLARMVDLYFRFSAEFNQSRDIFDLYSKEKLWEILQSGIIEPNLHVRRQALFLLREIVLDTVSIFLLSSDLKLG